MSVIRSDILVVGGGVSGLTAGNALARAGFRVTCVARDIPAAPGAVSSGLSPVPDLRVYALSGASRALLVRTGAWAAIREDRVAPVQSMCVFPSAGDEALPIDFFAADSGLPSLAHIVEQSELLLGLNRAVADTRLRLVQGEIVGLEYSASGDAVLLKLAGGTQLQGRLAVGADGAQSPLRHLAGIAMKREAYDQTAVVGRLRLARPHHDTAYQWFGEHGIVALLPQPDWPVPGGMDPVPSGHQVSLVWSAPHELATALLASRNGLAEKLRPICGPSVGHCDPLSDLAGFPLARQRAESLIGPRIVLVGDAAHVVHPLAGQGLNLGLGDVATLERVLTQARARWQGPRFDPGAPLLLRRYQRHRAEPLLLMQQAVHGLQRFFAPQGGLSRAAVGGPVAAVRDMGWNLVARSDRIRRLLIQYAAGSNAH